LEKIIPAPVPLTSWLLLASWLSFGLALVAVLRAMQMGQLAWQRQREILDINQHERKGWPLPNHLLGIRSIRNWEQNPFNPKIHHLNKLSFYSFSTGAVLFLVFVFSNFGVNSGRKAMADQKETREVRREDREERTAPAPSPRATPPREEKPKTQEKK
jgi:hypothetical protein